MIHLTISDADIEIGRPEANEAHYDPFSSKWKPKDREMVMTNNQPWYGSLSILWRY